MSSFSPRPPYSQKELQALYPKELELQQVQVLLRHGERTPVSARFQNAGLAPYWSYCQAARQMSNAVLASTKSSAWDALEWKRRLETFGADDTPTLVSGPGGDVDAVCKSGELTDLGRETTLALGQRLRHLYVEQLNFVPGRITTMDGIYLRATPIPRALESLQQAFTGFYPPNTRAPDLPPPTIVTRSPADETLFPNETGCKRFGRLAKAFAERAAKRWNDSDDMKYVNKVLGKWMPASSPRVAVDSHPRLSGIMDTINATKAHGEDTKLPNEFYDAKALGIIDRIVTEEWFAGYAESKEYRMLGIGALMGDIVGHMVGKVRGTGTTVKLALSGCHDTTLAGITHSLGASSIDEKWPPFTSHIAFELFKRSDVRRNSNTTPSSGWWQSLFGSSRPATARTSTDKLGAGEKEQMNGYFVRMRYNDRIMQIPACKLPGNHLEGAESFCTLAAFKSVVDKYTPDNWKSACNQNLDSSPFPVQIEPAGE